MNNQKEVNVIIQDYFEIVGTIIITIVIIYYLFIIKFIEIKESKLENQLQVSVKVYRDSTTIKNKNSIGNIGNSIGNSIGNIGNSFGNIGNSFGNIGNSVGNIGNSVGNIGNSVGNIRRASSQKLL